MTVPEPPSRLAPIVAAVRRRADARRAELPLAELRRRAAPDPARRSRFVEALARPGLAFIAECKRRSPSAGALCPAGESPSAGAGAGAGETASDGAGAGGNAARDREAAWLERARSYARGGADAVSVLTEVDHFHGALEDLAAVAACGLPRLRKDFVLDEGMVLESVLWGADAILLLPVILEPARLADLAALARELGLATLVEVHAAAELEPALAVGPDLLGVNARDLRTFEVDLAHVEALLPCVPPGPLKVAESGLRTLADLRRVRDCGADAALVGEALMRSPDPAATLAAWRAAL